MAKLYHPGGQELFQSLGKIIDFYYYKGQLCARSMPQHCKQPGTPEQQITWDAMRTRSAAYRLLTPTVIETFKRLALGSDKTWFDVFSTAWLNMYNKTRMVRPLVYDIIVRSDLAGYTILVKTNDRCTVREYFFWGLPEDRPWLWRWETQQDYDPPPNCSKRVRLRESWPNFRQIFIRDPNRFRAFPMIPRAAGFGRWSVFWTGRTFVWLPWMRTGVWHFGKGY